MSQNRSHVVVVGASHHTTPVSIRERLAVAPERIPALYESLRKADGVGEVIVLSTCNRLEVYGVIEKSNAAAGIEETLCAFQRFPTDMFARHRYVHGDREALSHLLEVAAGVDSQIVGEAEIFGQVKAAYSASVEHAAAGSILNRVFQKCFQAAKYIRSNTTIGEGRVNVATVATDLAGKIFGEINACRVLVLGTGEVGDKTARALASRGAGSITVLSREAERAASLAEAVAGTAGTLAQLEDRLPGHDIVIGSTFAASPVITEPAVRKIMRRRRLRPLFFIDLGMPRNFDPALAELESVFLYNLDDLARIADENLAARRTAIEHCREIAKQRAERIWQGVEPRLMRKATGRKAAEFQPREQLS